MTGNIFLEFTKKCKLIKRNGIDVYDNILICDGYIYYTNGDINIHKETPILKGFPKTYVNLDTLFNFINKLKNSDFDLSLVLDKDKNVTQLKFITKDGSFNIPCNINVKYPNVTKEFNTEYDYIQSLEIPNIRTCNIFTTTKKTMQYYGIYLHKEKIVSTDLITMYLIDRNKKHNNSFLLTKDIVPLLDDKNYTVLCNNDYYALYDGYYTYSYKKIYIEFGDFNKLVEYIKRPTIKISKDMFINTLLFAKTQTTNGYINIRIQDNKITISTLNDCGVSYENTISCESIQNCNFIINVDVLITCIKTVDSNILTMVYLDTNMLFLNNKMLINCSTFA